MIALKQLDHVMVFWYMSSHGRGYGRIESILRRFYLRNLASALSANLPELWPKLLARVIYYSLLVRWEYHQTPFAQC